MNKAYSTISNMKVLLSLNKSSLAPILLNTLSTMPISAASAGTKLPHCASIQMTAVCLKRVDFPPWFGPVMRCRWEEGFIVVLFGVNERAEVRRADSTAG